MNIEDKQRGVSSEIC